MTLHQPLPDGSGGFHFEELPNPAAGSSIQLQPPANVRRTYHSISFELTTDANVGNRRIQIIGGNFAALPAPSIYIVSSLNQPQNSTVTYFFATWNRDDAGTTTWDTVNPAHVYNLPAPITCDLLTTLEVIVMNGEVGDQISRVAISFEQWIVL